jgi:hypothetical protein
LLATSNAEWVESLQTLIARPDLREKLGYAGRRTVEERYSMRRSAGRFAQVVRETVAEWDLKQESSQWDTKSYKSSAR